jgi:hypothetical protein
MDWETHIVLAGKLLEASGLPKGAAISSCRSLISSRSTTTGSTPTSWPTSP